MDYEDILNFVQIQPVCTFATCEDNNPYARGFLTNIIDGQIYFTTSANKDVGKQIVKNRQAQLCYLSHDFSKMLRITTTLEILNDKKIKQHLIDTREYLQGFKADDKDFFLLGLSNSSATFWTLTDNLHEDELEVIYF